MEPLPCVCGYSYWAVPPVEFVVKCEQGEYGPLFLHGLTLALLRQTDVGAKNWTGLSVVVGKMKRAALDGVSPFSALAVRLLLIVKPGFWHLILLQGLIGGMTQAQEGKYVFQ